MREIKFRAWNIDKKIMWPLPFNCYGRWFGGKDEITNMGLEFGNGGWEDMSYAVDEEDIVLMQFTGLKDKNGKEIYEGDILYIKYPPGLMSSGHTHVVEWSETEDSYCYDVTSPHFTIDINLLGYYEIIGNIYENKELITHGQ